MSICNVKDPDELVVCPYDSVHVIKAIRMTQHLVKCQRNHPDVDLVSCPFNNHHRIPLAEHSRHMTTCPDRVSIERDFFKADDNHGNVTLPPVHENTVNVSTEENWDIETPSGGYNPAGRMINLRFQNPSTLAYMKPAQRRDYRKQLETRGFDNSEDDKLPEVVPPLKMLSINNKPRVGSGKRQYIANISSSVVPEPTLSSVSKANTVSSTVRSYSSISSCGTSASKLLNEDELSSSIFRRGLGRGIIKTTLE